MGDNVENFVLEHLRVLRAGQDRVEYKLSEVISCLNGLEAAVVKSCSDSFGIQEDIYRQ